MGWAEVAFISRERAAEPLWRGRSLLLGECERVLVGLGYGPDAVVRVFHRDVWSEPRPGGRLEAAAQRLPSKARKGWRDWDRFARWWASVRPTWHAEAWIAPRAEPVAVCYRDRDCVAERWAARLAAELELPLVPIRPLPVEWRS